MKKTLIGILLAIALLGGCTGARYFTWLVTDPHEKKIEAEYVGLKGRSLAVMIYCDERIQLDYPNLRLTLGAMITHQLRKHVKKISVVDPIVVTRYQDENLHWDTLSKKKIAEDLKVDYVLQVSLMEYTIRVAGQMNAFQGRINAEANLYLAMMDEADLCVWRSKGGSLKALYPHYAVYSPRAEGPIRRRTEELFAEILVKKFYTHKVLVEKQEK